MAGTVDPEHAHQFVVTAVDGGEAALLDGKRAILFLRAISRRGELRVVGMEQGVLHIRDRATSGATIPGGGQLQLIGADAPQKGGQEQSRDFVRVLHQIRKLDP